MITDLTRESALAELTDLFRTVQVPAHLDWGEFLAGTDWGEFCTRHGRNPEERTPPNYVAEFLSRCIMSSAPSAPAEYRRSRQFQQCVYICNALAGYAEIARALNEGDLESDRDDNDAEDAHDSAGERDNQSWRTNSDSDSDVDSD